MGRLSNPFGSVVSPYEEWRDLEGSLGRLKDAA